MVLLAKTLKNHYSAYKSNFDFLWFDHRTTLFCNLVHGFWSLDKFNNKGNSQWGIPQSGIFLSATYKAVYAWVCTYDCTPFLSKACQGSCQSKQLHFTVCINKSFRGTAKVKSNFTSTSLTILMKHFFVNFNGDKYYHGKQI